MLYQVYESQRALMAPFSEFASATAKLYNHPLSPFNRAPMAQRVSAGFDLIHRLAKDYEKPEFDIRTVAVNGIDVAVQEQVPITKPFCRLLRFKRFSDNPAVLEAMKNQPTVLVVAPLSGHHSTLLRDTVRVLLQDHKVLITDWTDARTVPLAEGPFHLHDYIEYVQEFIRFVGPEVNVVSVCQPTVPVFAAVSLMATHGEFTPRTLTMMGGPIDARRSPTSVNNLATEKPFEWFENNVIYKVPSNFAGAGRRVYPGFLQHTGFVAMNPDRHVTSHYDYFKDLIKGDDDSTESHRKFYDEYNAVLDMPAEYYLETIKTVFQDFSLVNGTWDVKGTLVRPQDITTSALLTVEGELDDISGAGQTRAAHAMCTGIPKAKQFHYDVEGAGHYGIFSGRRWREMVYPEVKAFIARYNDVALDDVAAVAKPATAAKAPSTVKAVKTPKAASPAVAASAPVTAAAAVVAPVAVASAAGVSPVVTSAPVAEMASVARVAQPAIGVVSTVVKAPAKSAVKALAQPAAKAAEAVAAQLSIKANNARAAVSSPARNAKSPARKG